MEFTDIRDDSESFQCDRYQKLSEMVDGEVIEGIVVGRHTNTKFENAQEVYRLFTPAHELVGVNGTFKLNGLMQQVPDGCYVRIRKTGERSYVDKKSGEDRTTVACVVSIASENPEVEALRAASSYQPVDAFAGV